MSKETLLQLLERAEGDSAALEQAEERFAASQEEARVYWRWGKLWRQAGDDSGEACDVKRAIDKFERAKDLELDEADFWVDYGEAVALLAGFVSDERLLKHALKLYSHAVKAAGDRADVWALYGRACLSAYDITGESVYFSESDRSLGYATELDPDEVEIWLDWAQLHRLKGHLEGTEEGLNDALIRVREAYGWAPESAEAADLMLQLMVEIAVMGEDRLTLLRMAEEEVVEAVELHPKVAALWCRYGEVLEALAAYFGEERQLDASLQKFRTALTFDSESIDAHMGVATVSYALGLVRNDFAMLERSATACAGVVVRDDRHAAAYIQWGQALLRMAEVGSNPLHAEGAREKFELAFLSLGGEPQAGLLAGYGISLDLLGVQSEDEELLIQAVRVLAKAVDLDGDEPYIRFHLAQAMGHLAEITCDPRIFEQAIEQMRNLAQRDPDDEVVWDEWGCLLVSLAHLIDDPVHALEASRLRQEAEEKLARAISLGSQDASYHLAWLYAHRGEMEPAIHWLERARERGTLPPREDLLDDEWLKNLHDHDAFQALLRSL